MPKINSKRTKQARKPRAAVLCVAVLLGVGACHTPTYNVASDLNKWYLAYADYNRTCLNRPDFDLQFCSDYFVALRDAERLLLQAASQNVAGGSIAPQVKSLKKAMKKVDDYGSRRISPNPARITPRPTVAPPPAGRAWRDAGEAVGRSQVLATLAPTGRIS